MTTPLTDMTNFYPRPPRGGRPLLVGIPPTVRVISIHALREEGDRGPDRAGGRREISIHALREEGDSKSASALEPPE